MEQITLGAVPDEPGSGVTIPVYAQRWGYLANRCGTAVAEALSRGDSLTSSSLLTWAGDGVYDVLAALIPNLEKRLPREKFASEDEGPTVPEIREAFRVALRVNEIDDLPGMLGKALGPQGTNYLRAVVLEKMTEDGSTVSLTSPSPSGDSESTSSTATSPTPTPSGDSPSLASEA